MAKKKKVITTVSRHDIEDSFKDIAECLGLDFDMDILISFKAFKERLYALRAKTDEKDFYMVMPEIKARIFAAIDRKNNKLIVKAYNGARKDELKNLFVKVYSGSVPKQLQAVMA